MTLLGMCVDKMSIRDLKISSVISSTSNELKAAAQLMFETDKRIASFSAFDQSHTFLLKGGGCSTDKFILPNMMLW